MTPYGYEDAERRFRRQARSFLTIIAMLFAINAVTGWGHWWFQWPALGMGIGLAFSYKRMLDAKDGAAESPVNALAPEQPEDDLTRRAELLVERERQAR